MSAHNVRVTGSDVDALDGVSEFERRLVERIDAEVMDPHVPVSLVEMGMIYDVHHEGADVTVEMTYPCMGCPAYQMLQDDVEEALLDLDGVEDVSIEVVWDPVWSKDRLDEDVQRKLRESGTAI
ncbi:metal-sulfur cluster assembly factor [Halorarum salinum]|uniref:Metal-sulfur cluster assembly factor n=1 Tax=Halorarum salinum TaxID=2743089 RepID=A0A7D5LDA5_9EURY|nr:metal-sulfur cluster assembly factor [Halobaculum salinum]QLG63910.1 metal-sulfur cluster assembly factor [Halobaculum salinum]